MDRRTEEIVEAARLTHVDDEGRPRMVDVGAKPQSERTATAEGFIRMLPGTLDLIEHNQGPKGDPLVVARIAGIQAAKRTAELIPLCHPLALSHVDVELEPDRERSGIRVRATARVVAQTGVEMEALTAVATALLTVYDMLKAVDRGMTIEGIRLIRKSGGRSGDWRAGP